MVSSGHHRSHHVCFQALLMRLLHITGAVAVGGIILVTLAIEMVHGPGKNADEVEALEDRNASRFHPLAVPFAQPGRHHRANHCVRRVVSVASVALVVALVLLVGAFDYAIFANIDKVAKRLRPTSLVISEVIFGILLTAVAVQLVVAGLNLLGIIATPGAEH
jgi:multiple antibiotic resistance protein